MESVSGCVFFHGSQGADGEFLDCLRDILEKRVFSEDEAQRHSLMWLNFHVSHAQMLHGTRTYIHLHENHKNQPNVGKYTTHGWYGTGSRIPIKQASSKTAKRLDLKWDGEGQTASPWRSF